MQNNEQPFIIPVASGKGGVGKSFLTANIALALAKKSKETIAIDLDLGGSNLYSYLGMQNTNPGLGEYFRDKKPLKDYIVDTGFENLKFLAGEGRTTFMANLKYLQKKKLLKEIGKLEADYILLDLGAGTTFNTLDFFDMAGNGLVISTFEAPAIMNTLSFLKNYLFRKIAFHSKPNTMIWAKLNEIYQQSSISTSITIKNILEIIGNIDTHMAEEIKNVLRRFNPRILFNMVNSKEELELVRKVETGIVKNLSLNVEYFGYISYHQDVRTSILNRRVFLDHYPDNAVFNDINKIADKLISNGNMVEKESLEKLLIS